MSSLKMGRSDRSARAYSAGRVRLEVLDMVVGYGLFWHVPSSQMTLIDRLATNYQLARSLEVGLRG